MGFFVYLYPLDLPSGPRHGISKVTCTATNIKDPSHFRVLNLTVSTFNDNSPTSYFHKSVGGYHGAKMERYQELIDTALSHNLQLIQMVGNNAKTLEDFQTVFNGTSALNMLNTKYIIYNPEAPPLVNLKALGNAWFAETPVLVENANMEISSINKFDPLKEAVIDDIFKDQITKPSYPVSEQDKIELISYRADELVYKYSANEEKLAVFSEIYYPAGWKAYIDGKECNYFRTNYVLRGMIVPSGNHEIKFSFEPSSYITGNKISLASSILLILLIAGFLVSKILIKSKSE